MTVGQLLSDKLKLFIEEDIISDKEVPSFIRDNINNNFVLRKYQIEALNCLRYYIDKYKRKVKPVHLLFNMATGSGKTLLMATNILYLYEKGYRNFIFFVNSTNIIEKTKHNFLDSTSSKYFFSQKININGKNIEVREVNNFDEADDSSINIVFTTIQGLHYSINTPSEGSITIEDFKDRKVVLLSDEAHHLNTLTKNKLSKTELEEKSSWEYTVNTILHSNIENILLEYTATAELDNPSIFEKYKDKAIYIYDLKSFRKDGFSKEVTVLQSDLDTKNRILQAVIVSEYRRKVAEKSGLLLKPVILIKSKTINQSKDMLRNFLNWIEELKVEELEWLFHQGKNSVIEKAYSFFKKENITLSNLIIEIKNNFSKDKCIEVNSKEDSEQKQIIVNTLEDMNNPYRVVFAVDKLNEGWDVLNLFDIVRVDEGRGSKATTTKEAQLIGRGARYFPFSINPGDDKFKRKYDEDLENDLRILEELYYHSINEPKYISDLRKELRESGIMPAENERKEVFLKLKDSFKNSEFYKNGFIFTNRQKVNKNKNISSLKDMEVELKYEYRLKTGYLKEIYILENVQQERVVNLNRVSIYLVDIEKQVLRKALSKNDFYKFNNLKKYFPKISSIDEFMTSNSYLGGIEVTLIGNFTSILEIDNEELLEVVSYVLKKIENKVKKKYIPMIGSREFYITPVNQLNFEKKVSFSLGGEDKEFGKSMSLADGSPLRLDLSKEKWYAYEDNYGTTEEKSFILLMKEMYKKIKDKGYSDIFIIRNEKLFKLYHFDDDRVIEPDFLLCAKLKCEDTYNYYQLFVEPKGDQLLETDKWKEDLLLRVQSEYKVVLNTSEGNVKETKDIVNEATDNLLVENDKFKIIGLCFYNKKYKESEFRKSLEESLSL